MEVYKMKKIEIIKINDKSYIEASMVIDLLKRNTEKAISIIEGLLGIKKEEVKSGE
jgi:hypothetical protein